MLYQPGETGAGHVQGRTRALRFGPVVAITFVIARIHVPILSVLAIAIHGEVAPYWGKKTYLRQNLLRQSSQCRSLPLLGARDKSRDNGWGRGIARGARGGCAREKD